MLKALALKGQHDDDHPTNDNLNENQDGHDDSDTPDEHDSHEKAIKIKYHTLSYKFAVKGNNVYLVRNMAYTSNVRFSCKSKFFPIEVELNKELHLAYLDEDSNIIRTEQASYRSCKKIKKFKIDEKKSILVINDVIDTVETSKINVEIAYHLLKEWELWTLFMFTANIYDETNDKIDYKVNFELEFEFKAHQIHLI
jgi:hypothetical protein